ncbi:cytochrome d ubiquinol oxidase subunit II [Planctobacterium marinum]|uniref:Cytochrome bd ubiquinol oxidase subunit II n=1 Tax=Planctobacterium marinum TaxID=1631968 RepID=A0AA48HMI7_9ALTE|nr:cytochrome bd ubiquinol oxidase subunit II [Planctobacterium marinum]
MIPDTLLPDVFAGLMALAIVMYAILDGYDLGVGMLLPAKNEHHRDIMIASIGPFWDANETWLVLAVGLLLIAFPQAHSLILGELYLPVVVMLIGLILRGVAFDFRAKVRQGRKELWDKLFKIGSYLAAGIQGFMLGLYVMGFENDPVAYGFALLSAAGVIAAFRLIGACWLVMRTENELQKEALEWAKETLFICVAGIFTVCLVNPLANPAIFHKWFSGSGLIMLAIVPTLAILSLVLLGRALNSRRVFEDKYCIRPFALVVLLFLTCFAGLAFSFYPYVVPGNMTIQATASAPESLRFILIGALIVMPCILAYTAFSYRVFRGKVTELRYH